MAQHNIPKLRFPEFSGAWEEKKLGDITDKINSGKTPLGGEKAYTGNGIVFIRSQNVNDNVLDLNNSTYISERINKSMKNSIVKPLDILLNITGASLGRSCVVPDDFKIGNVNQHVCIIRLKKNNISYFLQPILASQNGQNIFASLQTGSGREGLNFESIKSIKLFFPTLPEQQKIAAFLTAVDKKLEQLQQKKALLEQYKKGMMQKLFSQQIRFKDDEGMDFPEWEEKELGEVAFKKSSNISANAIEENVGNYIIYGATGILKRIDFFKEDEKYISIIKDGAGVGRLFVCEKESSVLGTMDIIKPKESTNIYFLYSVLQQIDFSKFTTGSTIPHIYFKDYSKVSVGIPSLAEQTKIADFLTAIDAKINAVSTQIDNAKTFKKGLLQQMFV